VGATWLAAAACGSSDANDPLLLAKSQGYIPGASVAPNEPLQVANGQFTLGPLPGRPPFFSLDGGPENPADLTQRAIITGTSATITGPGVVPAGDIDDLYTGFATSDSVAIGVELKDLSTGYWVVPTAGFEANTGVPGVNWAVTANFNPAAPAGHHVLRFVAIDAAGRAGTQVDASVCIDPAVPDNMHTCLPNRAPPAAVISLKWDDNFDLDLHVVTPDGTEINQAHPLLGSPDGVAPARTSPASLCSTTDTFAACLDHDSFVNCIPDGLRQEDVIFPASPAPGLYKIYVDPFAPCGQVAVRFTTSVYVLTGACPNCGLVRTFTQSGELLSFQVTGGASTGLFVAQIELPQGH
jgi:hypothetical protein